MSDAAEPDVPEEPDADAWATACEEDLAAERARRRAEYGPQHGSAAEELRRLADAVSEKVAELGKPFGATLAGTTAQGVAQQLIGQARAALEPVVERNPQVFDHLAAAGGELLAAYRAAVQEAEGRWTAGAADPSRDSGASGSGTGDAAGQRGNLTSGPAGPSGAAGSSASVGLERIDLDKGPRETREPGASGDAARGGSGDAARGDAGGETAEDAWRAEADGQDGPEGSDSDNGGGGERP